MPSRTIEPSDLKLDELEKSNEENSQETVVESKNGILSKLHSSISEESLNEINEFDMVTSDNTEEEK